MKRNIWGDVIQLPYAYINGIVGLRISRFPDVPGVNLQISRMWKSGNFVQKVWKSRNLEISKFGNLEIWKLGNLEIWTFGHFGNLQI